MPQAKTAQGIIMFTGTRYTYPSRRRAKIRPPPEKTIHLVIMPMDRQLPQLFRIPHLLRLPPNAEPTLYNYLSETLFSAQSAGPYWLRETRISVTSPPAPQVQITAIRTAPHQVQIPLQHYRNWLKYRLERLWPTLPQLKWSPVNPHQERERPS